VEGTIIDESGTISELLTYATGVEDATGEVTLAVFMWVVSAINDEEEGVMLAVMDTDSTVLALTLELISELTMRLESGREL
jgi:hypothetical protein